MATQKAVVINETGPASVLKYVTDYPVPERKPGEVLLRIVSTSVNPIDYKVREGHVAKETLVFPKVLGGEAAGVVAEADPASKFKVGDKVYACTDTAMPSNPLGTYCELLPVSETKLVHVPDNLPLDQAGGVPLAALTAWQALDPHANVKPGSRVLVLAAAGGVGHLAAQIAKAFGAHVIGTAGPANQDFLKELGVDEPMNYRTQTIADAAVNGPFDVVVDLIGGQQGKDAYKHLKPTGVMGHVFNTGSDGAWIHSVQAAHAEGKGPNVTTVLTKSNASQLSEISDLIAQGKVKLVVSKTFPLDKVAEAHTVLERGTGSRGKLIIKVQDV